MALLAWSLAVVLQLAVRKIQHLAIGSEVANFMDLCSLTNISVLILDEP